MKTHKVELELTEGEIAALMPLLESAVMELAKGECTPENVNKLTAYTKLNLSLAKAMGYTEDDLKG